MMVEHALKVKELQLRAIEEDITNKYVTKQMNASEDKLEA